jgi:flotillin
MNMNTWNGLTWTMGLGLGAAVVAFAALMLAFAWREVVETNVVHIVQSRKKTTSYGTGQDAGNVYYAFPSYLPFLGLSRIILPVNNFNLDLNDYRAYDKDRVPFVLHVTAFFRINDTNKAAERVQGFEELKGQLELVVKGAVRKILASHDIHGIMTDRATFGKQFTEEVATELANWGVEPVKNMELMDIKDDAGSSVIANIMAKKSSHIEMESRVEVATNKQKAETAEIEAKRTIELTNIEAKRVTELSVIDANQVIGEKHAAQEKSVGVAKEKAAQDIKGEAATTMEREMKILAVQTQRKAELEKAAGVVKAEETAAVTKTVAEGNLEKARREAEAVRLAGEAKAAAEKAMQLAPVEAQIVLAKEIGENQGYQTYLVTLRKVEAEQAIGIAQAASLEKADIKIIANSGSASAGISGLGELISSKGGQQVGAFLDGLKNTETGGKLVEKATGNGRASA